MLLTTEDGAIRVVTCLQKMGEQQSNPVLEILDPQVPFIEDQKYPENKLVFNNGVWRAYYHCHAPPYRFENEHGHFHIFHKIDENNWTHIVALSINSQGQPQKWFATNRLADKSSIKDVLEDHKHYILAELDIQLQDKLTSELIN